ncbi:MAG TPA: HlyD family type I secretion periplasmic adaptor subunit [Rhizobiales bacterium]|nr:HlyD family type I secretion periplasmic adaptor subunit [Hyphomicrobiales bacterium]
MSKDAAALQQKLQQAINDGQLKAGQRAEMAKEQKLAPRQAPSGLPSSASADLMKPPSRSARLMSLSLAAAVFAAIIWAKFAYLEEVTRGQGKVVPASKVQVVQNLEGGIIRDIAIRPGAVVHKGQLLLKIDPTGFDAKLNEHREQVAGLKARIVRLSARLDGKELSYDKAFAAAYPILVAQNRKLYASRSNELKAALAALDQKAAQKQQEMTEIKARKASLARAVAIARQELDLTAKLARDQIVSKAELLAAQGKENDLAGQLEAAELALPRLAAGLAEIRNMRQEKNNSFKADILARLNDSQIKYSALEKTIEGDTDRVQRTEVRSPVDGIVKALYTSTIGQVVKPGADLVEIVPQDDSLLVETRIRPQDIAFLRIGQKAVVKLTAYDYALYGSLEGKLVRIGADSITGKKGETYYLVDVRTNENHLSRNGKNLPIIPGMVAGVDILTGEKTVLNYMTKPMHRMASEALRER